MRSWKWMFSYILAASLGLWLALVISFKFVRPAHSQTPPASNAPSSGELPPEFMNDAATATATPAAPETATPPTTAATPAPATSATPTSTPSAAQTPPPAPSAASTPGPAQTPVPAAQAQPPGATEPEPETVTAPSPSPRLGAEDYVYDPTGRRDPFKPYKTLLAGTPPPKPSTSNGGAVRQTPVEPLQRWDVERFKVVGILWEVHSPKAMVKDPDGTLYTLVKNTKIGRYNGYVAAIREGEIVVIETYEIDGKMQKDTKVLELGK